MSYFPRCPSAETPEPPKNDDDEEAEEGEGASGVIQNLMLTVLNIWAIAPIRFLLRTGRI